jgi:hypothetical protein
MFTKLESRNESAKESGAMRLLQFKVTDFRSIGDSDWIDFAGVTALIGTNESGKTNLLLYLWKLNPTGEDGEIDLLADAPRSVSARCARATNPRRSLRRSSN